MRRQDDKFKFIGTDSWILRRIIVARACHIDSCGKSGIEILRTQYGSFGKANNPLEQINDALHTCE